MGLFDGEKVFRDPTFSIEVVLLHVLMGSVTLVTCSSASRSF
jgi:hypothetical protein